MFLWKADRFYGARRDGASDTPPVIPGRCEHRTRNRDIRGPRYACPGMSGAANPVDPALRLLRSCRGDPHGHRPTTTQLTDAERIDRLRLIRSDNVGPRTFHSLIRHFGSARAALERLPTSRCAAAPIVPDGSAMRTMPAPNSLPAKDRCQPARAGGGRLSAAARHARRRAAVARRARREDTLMRPMIAVVGSRNASGAGLKFAGGWPRSRRGRFCHRVGVGARHRPGGASRQPCGGTVAVLAGGHDDLSARARGPAGDIIVSGGAAISEMPLGHVPRARDFPGATG